MTMGITARGSRGRRGYRLRLVVAAIAATALAGCGPSSTPKPADEVPRAAEARAARPGDARPRTEPAGDGRYEGRPIAQTCSYLGADWLDRSDRDEREQPDRVLEALHLGPQSTVADVGAGTGYFTLR